MKLKLSEEQARAIQMLAGGDAEIEDYCMAILSSRNEPVHIESEEEFEESYRRSLALVEGIEVKTLDGGSFVVEESDNAYKAMKCISILGFNHAEAIKVIHMVAERTERELGA